MTWCAASTSRIEQFRILSSYPAHEKACRGTQEHTSSGREKARCGTSNSERTIPVERGNRRRFPRAASPRSRWARASGPTPAKKRARQAAHRRPRPDRTPPGRTFHAGRSSAWRARESIRRNGPSWHACSRREDRLAVAKPENRRRTRPRRSSVRTRAPAQS